MVLCGVPQDEMIRVSGSATARAKMAKIPPNSPDRHFRWLRVLMADLCVAESVCPVSFTAVLSKTGPLDSALDCKTAVMVTMITR